ncbi:hypothetical protein [Arthrobacter globiformis]|uniref:hypothetical protein n=1 Tax=Arthrobacter globiformis TaxID=1665 RepID=UPI0027912701|nr:hypothetical protein [Arthrobacter globiformis]MDQ0616415.1 hypothetical protein [Arthrobacter globiformis]
MGIGDSIGKAAENAMEDLAQMSDPTDDAHAPEPGASDEDIQVHSSISEGSNARDGDDGPRSGVHTTYTPQGPGTEASGGQGTAGASGTGEAGAADESAGTATSGGIGAAGTTDAPEAARGVPGPAGLPDPDPEELRADPSEGDQDPGTGLGRG